ncbi:MAG: hypothetical protein JWO72_687 [Caulobacteraceae bacterium]|jgi:hypothetical protein|nr:hypothetical protein [Caulobacteraceae bacterium]
MTQAADDEWVELSDEELEEMLEDAIDVLAMSLPEEADDDYWRRLREVVEARSREMLDRDLDRS